ncbi:helix-turn-helix transcriptional regulator [Dactylosporangium sucinum]|uniref:HTH luxR-type domain-containing protein n=1 Tax=Dactylosporangium sucinum TaxID=1424081 RepID=A0A917U3A6_9ACTN|nr:helix-turn-helix transcriptional regulator [Dactylosporangium sucinum]GGM53760.1 hypothetical protein GCM10007977_064200 [Dactylosporangium sucinum]
MTDVLTVDEARAAIDARLREIDELWAAARAVAPVGARPLSPAERAVARLAAWSHLTMSEIARERGVSVNTVKTQLRKAYGALGVHRRSQLAPALREAERISGGAA